MPAVCLACWSVLLCAATVCHSWVGDFSSGDWPSSWQPQERSPETNTLLVVDPSGSGKTVLKVEYGAGVVGSSGGFSFQGSAGGLASNKACLEYRVMFASDFDWVKGGKLPGLFGVVGGDPLQGGCSGGSLPMGDECFSVRLMWRQDGMGEVYMYSPPLSEQQCAQAGNKCSLEFGNSIGRGNFHFKRGQWQTVMMELSLNNVDSTDGYVKLWLENELVVDQQHLELRNVEELQVRGIYFSTFFGGSDETWAPNATQASFFDQFLVEPVACDQRTHMPSLTSHISPTQAALGPHTN